MLKLITLGVFEVRDHADRLLKRPPTAKAQSLFVFLAYHPEHAFTRERLISMFWNDYPERKARHSLSTALWHIRNGLTDDCLRTDMDRVSFHPTAPCWLDARLFAEYAKCHDLYSLETAAALYRGPFLDGFYDDWIVSERYHLEHLYMQVLAQLMALYDDGKRPDKLLDTALHLLALDPLREDAHRAAMRAYCRLGQRPLALKQYDLCCAQLQADLGIAPLTETRALKQAIVAGRLPCSTAESGEYLALSPLVQHVATYNPLSTVGRPPLVARDRELSILADAWQAALAAQCSLILISGESGIGKTRLVQEFAEQQRWQGLRVVQGRCYEFERMLPYQPIADALRALPADLILATAAELPPWAVAQVARLLPERLPQSASAPDRDEQTRLFEGLSLFLTRLTGREPLLLVLEDLQWATDSVLQLLHYLARHLIPYPLLVAGTLRSEALTPAHPSATLLRRLERDGLARRLPLARLTLAAVGELIGRMAANGAAVEPLTERLYRETEGNPFFLIETLKALFERGVIRVEQGAWHGDFERLSRDDLPLPTGVEEMIGARFGRLPPASQQVAVVAAVAGKTFDFDVLSRASEQAESVTLAALDDLLCQQLVREGSADDPDYVFTHHKIQEVIYSGLQRKQRQLLHARVGCALESLAGPEREARAGELAHHFERACGLQPAWADKAVDYLLLAGRQAARQSANAEAINCFRRGLALVAAYPEVVGRRELELALALTVPTTVICGYGAPETRQIYQRAEELARRVADTAGQFTALMGLSRSYGVAGDVAASAVQAREMLAIAQAQSNTDMLTEACRGLGGPLLAAGRSAEARAILEQGLAHWDASQHESHAYRYGHDPIVPLLGYLGFALWLLGYPDQAAAQSRRLRDLLPSFTHPTTLAYAHCLLAMLASMRGALPETLTDSAAALQVAHGQHLPSWAALAAALHGWAVARRGEAATGLTELSDGIDAWRARGSEHFVPFLLALQAEACLQAHRSAEAAAALAAGQALAQNGGDRYWSAELSRLSGDLASAQGDPENAATSYEQALTIARAQSAHLLELRAALSLAGLRQRQGDYPAAAALLTPVYAQFDEGFDTPELQAAGALLATLTGATGRSV